MKFIKFYLIVILVLEISMQSCVKKGCSDSRATNFNSFVREDDGSCLYVDHTLFVVGNYNGTKRTFSNSIGGITNYNDTTVSFTVQKAGLFDTLQFDGFRLAYAASDSEPKYFSFYTSFQSGLGYEIAYIHYSPEFDSIYCTYFNAHTSGNEGVSYFGKKH